MTSRNPNDLHPALQDVWAVHQAAAKAELGLDLLLTCTHRPLSEQAKLYAQGRTAPGLIVTNAKPGQSAHNVEPPEGAHAYDFAVSDGRGGVTWKTDLYVQAAKIAQRLGADCGAFWTGFQDAPHVQMPDWHPGRVYGPAFRIIKPAPPAPAPDPAPVPWLELTDRAGNVVRTPYRQATYYGVGFELVPGGVRLIPPHEVTK